MTCELKIHQTHPRQLNSLTIDFGNNMKLVDSKSIRVVNCCKNKDEKKMEIEKEREDDIRHIFIKSNVVMHISHCQRYSQCVITQCCNICKINIYFARYIVTEIGFSKTSISNWKFARC